MQPDRGVLLRPFRDLGQAARPLVVVDIRMPPTFTDEGARAAYEIKRSHPHVGVLVLSQHIETSHAIELVTLGDFGYLLKDRVLAVDEFLDAEGSPVVRDLLQRPDYRL